MKVIKEARKNIALLWRAPKPSPAVYRPMKFLLQARVDDGLLLYNVVTSEMILLDADEEQVFQSLPAAYSSEMDALIGGHYIVAEGFDENRSVSQLRALVRKLEPSKRVNGFTILPTTECNARCYYCFQSDFEHCTMTEGLAEDTVEYIVEKCKGEPIEIGWFGGEPLVGSKRISQICESLKKKGVEFRSSMVSNAYLFDNELVQEAKNEWNLSTVQITLDGTEAIYNATKAYVAARDNPYQRVLQNIGYLLENEIDVCIRFNVTDKNFKDLNVLIDDLAERFGKYKRFGCYPHAVYEGVGYSPLSYIDQDLIDSQTVALDIKLREKGLLGSYSRLPYLQVTHCMADNDSARLIYPDGMIGKCENKSSLENIGDIYHDITNEEKDEWYRSAEHFPECADCCLFPYCINLTVCPETGKCSTIKREWKKRRYTELMRNRYQKSKQDDYGTDAGIDKQNECES